MTMNTSLKIQKPTKVNLWVNINPKSIKDLIFKLSDDIQWYERKSNIKTLKKIRPNLCMLKDTIELYKQNHPKISEIIDFTLTKSFFKSFKEYDIVIMIDGKCFLWHTYKLLHFIYINFETLALYEDGTIFKSTFAVLKGDKAKYKKKKNKHLSESKEPDVSIKGAETLKAYIYKLHINNNEEINALLNNFTLIPIHQYKIIEKEEDILKNFLYALLKYYGTSNITSDKPILKSIGILLYGYLTQIMKVPTNKAFLTINQNFYYGFLYDLSEGYYEYQLTDQSRLLKNVYITGRINMTPIFGSRKTKPDTNKISKLSDTLFSDIKKELNLSIDFPINNKINPLINPLSPFYNLTPLELLQPKM